MTFYCTKCERTVPERTVLRRLPGMENGDSPLYHFVRYPPNPVFCGPVVERESPEETAVSLKRAEGRH